MPRRKGQTSPRKVCIGLRSRAWWVLRKNRVATLAELLSTLADGSQSEPESNLGRYLCLLALAGILHRERVADGKLTSNGVYRYHVRIDVGPQPPVVRTDGVYDPNARQMMPYGDGESLTPGPSPSSGPPGHLLPEGEGKKEAP